MTGYSFQLCRFSSAGFFRPLVRCALWLLAACLSAPTMSGEVVPPDAGRSARTLVIGKVTHNPKKHYARLMPLAKYLVDRMGDLGVVRAEVRLTRSVNDMAQLLAEGKVDLITETPYGAVSFIDRVGAEPILLKWKKGVREYRSIIVVHKDSGINSLKDLKGKVIAFEDPDSTSAYLLPFYELLQANIDLMYLVSPRAVPIDGKLGYVFSQSEQNTAAWVYKGLVAAGAISDLDWNKKSHVTPRQRRGLKVLHESAPVPRALELVRGNLDPLIKERIRKVLLALPHDPDAAYVREQNQQTSKYEDIDDNVLDALQRIREIAAIVNGGR